MIDLENSGGGDEDPVFDLEKAYETEIKPLVKALADKTQALGMPIFVVVCYKTDQGGAWMASTSRGRDGFVPREFYMIRALLEGEMKVLCIPKLQ
jgi:hypothetical protein